MPTPLDWQSLNINEERIQQLQQIMPELFSEWKLDPEAMKKYFWDNYDKEERYGINRAGKYGAIQTIKHRTSETLHPDKDSSVDRDTTGNLFIEWDNLDALRILQKSYYGKVKMIYIDPPYNTGSDNFVYPDDFSQTQKEYLKKSWQLDEDGNLKKDDFFRKNSKDSWRYHSNWLGMMYPRLFLARNLLRDDGVIFVSIDDNEVHNLRMVMNEIFWEENFIWCYIWNKKNVVQNDAKHLSVNHEYVLVYWKNAEELCFNLLSRTEEQLNRYSNPDNDPRWKRTSVALQAKSWSSTYEITFANWVKWKPVDWTYPRLSKESILKAYNDWRLRFWKDWKNVPRLKKYLSEVKSWVITSTLLMSDDVWSTQWSKEWLKKIMQGNYFDTPKPIWLMDKFLNLWTSKNDIILDFFAWSWTIAHAVMNLNAEDGGNRKYILVQFPEATEKWSEAYKAGYKTIADISRERIRRAGKKIKEEKWLTAENLDIGFKAFVVGKSNFKIWKGNEINDQTLFGELENSINNIKNLDSPLSMLYELMLKHGVDLSTSIKKESVEKYSYYNLGEGALIVCLDKEVNQNLIDHLLSQKPARLIMLDHAFKNNDQLMTNTRLQAESSKITFQVL